ncbi:MAG: hypothetical protein CMM25_03545 [Rhodospirillaceae bacterium]|nr:hypothetical protein [Rhodospirillaceae bacterium]
MTLNSPLPRIAVIGLGHMGQHHVNACVRSNRVTLTAVVDKNEDKARQIASERSVQWSTKLQDIMLIADLAIIAVPTHAHATTTIPLLKSHIPCLLEKPIAATEKEAEEILLEASTNKTTLCVGHVERFNPNIIKLKERLPKNSVVNRFVTKRLNKINNRSNDLDAILDLMIHDIDLMRFLNLGSISEINSVDFTDVNNITSRLKLVSGTDVEFGVSRSAINQKRCISISINNESFEIDLTSKEYCTQHNDPLRLQLSAFVDAIQGKETPIATGSAGLEALHIANKMRRMVGLSG